MRPIGPCSLALCAWMLLFSQFSVAQPQTIRDERQQPVVSAEQKAASEENAAANQSPVVGLQDRAAQMSAATQRIEVAWLPTNLVAYVSVCANVIVGIAVLFTLIAVKRQSRAAEHSAKAAVASAEAILISERAWIQIKPFPLQPAIRDFGPPAAKRRRSSPLSIVNVGKTPARIMSISGSYLVVHRLSDLPARPEYEQRDDFRGMILAPQESIGHLIESLDRGDVQSADLVNKKLVAYVHAKVIYEDAFGNEHETREGFHLDLESPVAGGKPRLVRAGPPGYHAST